MKQKSMKVAAYALVGIIAFTGVHFQAGATGVSTVLPAAGLALVLDEGTKLEEMQQVGGNELFAQAVANNIGTEETTLEDILNPGMAVIPAPEAVAKLESDTIIIDDVATATTVSPILLAEQPVIPEVSTVSVSANETAVSENAVTEEEAYFSTLVIAQVNDYVNVRSIPSEDGEIVGKLYDKSVGELVSVSGDWYEIKSGNCTGFVKSEYVVTGEAAIALAKEVGNRIATVTTTTLKVREAPSMDATVLGLVPIEDKLSVIEEMDGWIKVSIEEGEGYVSSEFVSLNTEFVKAESKAEEEARLAKEEADRKAAQEAAKASGKKANTSKSSGTSIVAAGGGSGTGTALANYALQFVGNPYVYGGTSLTNGTDCSGFTMGVYGAYGVSLPHSSGAQRSYGTDVGGLENAQPGDLVCYSGHVALYIGNGQIVHASTSKTGIIVSNASYRTPLAVRRIF